MFEGSKFFCSLFPCVSVAAAVTQISCESCAAVFLLFLVCGAVWPKRQDWSGKVSEFSCGGDRGNFLKKTGNISALGVNARENGISG